MVKILLSTLLGERKWSQADLARMTGIRPNTISDLYNEFAMGIRLEHLDLICEALDCDVQDLIQVTRDAETRVNPARTPRTHKGAKK